MSRPCLQNSNGYGETCHLGIPSMIHDAGVEISADIIPEVNRHPAVTAAAVEAGCRLGRRLKAGHDRMAVAGNMQEKMMVMVDAIA